MKRTIQWLIVVTLVMTTFTVPRPTSYGQVMQSGGSCANCRWEYKVVTITAGAPASVEGQLNQLGGDRWELVEIQQASRLYIFKRSK
jgi:hypothetical protein